MIGLRVFLNESESPTVQVEENGIFRSARTPTIIRFIVIYNIYYRYPSDRSSRVMIRNQQNDALLVGYTLEL